MAIDATFCEQFLKENNRDLWFCSMFMPQQHRASILTLYAFHTELARIHELVTSPLPGEVRLQWWYDLLQGKDHGEIQANPLANALLQTIEEYNLPKHFFASMCQAHEFDLYQDQMPTHNDWEGYYGETISALFQLIALVIDKEAANKATEISGLAGVVFGMTRDLSRFAFFCARQKNLLPKDISEKFQADLPLNAKQALSENWQNALKTQISHIEKRREELKTALENTPAKTLAAILPAILTPLYLKKIINNVSTLHSAPITVSQWRKQWRLFKAAKSENLDKFI